MATHLEPNETADTLEMAQPSGIGPFRVAWRHQPLLALGLVVGLVLGALYFARATPLYQSSSKVLVVRTSPGGNLPVAPAENSQPSNNEDYLSTQQSLIQCHAVIAGALKEPWIERKKEDGKGIEKVLVSEITTPIGAGTEKFSVAELPTLQRMGDRIKEIQETLKISQELNNGKPTNILIVSYRSYSAEDAGIVVKAIIASYQKFLKNRYQSGTDQAAKMVVDANKDLDKKVIKKQEELEELTQKHPGFLWKGKDGLSSTQERMIGLEAKRSLLLMQRTEIEGKLEAFKKAVQDGKYTRPELMAMIASQQTALRQAMDAGTATAAIEERLLVLDIKEKDMSALGPNHPDLKSLHNQIAGLKELLVKRGKSSADEAGSVDPIKAHLLTLRLDLDNAKMAAASVDKFIAEETKRAADNHAIEGKERALREEIEMSKTLLNATTKRIDEYSVLRNFTGSYDASTIAPAQAGYKVHPRALIVFLTASVLGLLAGFGLAYLAELADQSFRTPEEIRRLLGLPVVGHIPFFGPDEAPAEGAEPVMGPTLCTIHRPKSRESEAYRGVRTAIFFSNRTEGVKVIQVTSPDMADGKSTLAANLAVSIAQSEKKVILIDADFRRPRLHKMFNVPGKMGLASVIMGEAELQDVIQPTTIPNLFILPCGPIPPNPAELLTVNRFAETLTAIREQFDFVVIDTPPLLAVTDPCVVVPHVDAVILTVRISKNARPHASRAKEILATLGANVLGVVVNAVGRDAQGYGYDNYRYGYTYRYTDYYYNYEQTPTEGDAPKGNQAGRSRRRHSANKKKGLVAWLLNR